jgi:hypothetical protein
MSDVMPLCEACGSSSCCAEKERQRIKQIIESLIGPGTTDVGRQRNEAFLDALAAIDEGAHHA